jgi:plasmid maintenance system antidote protein VapI
MAEPESVPRWPSELSKAFDTSAESWLNHQIQYDLWIAEQSAGALRIKKLVAA